MRGVRHALFGTRNSILYLLVQVAEVLGTRFSDGLHSEAENSVSQSVGLLENGLSLKGPFVFLAGRDKHRGPSERAGGREECDACVGLRRFASPSRLSSAAGN